MTAPSSPVPTAADVRPDTTRKRETAAMSAESKKPASFDPSAYFLNLKGKQYLPVAPRVAWMRSEHPAWGIITEMVHVDWEKCFAVFRATIMDETGRILATATKQEDVRGFADWAEKAESGSIGRALALCGYGTLQAMELEEGLERIADAPQAARPPASKPATPAPAPAHIAAMLEYGEVAARVEEIARTPDGRLSPAALKASAIRVLGGYAADLTWTEPEVWQEAKAALVANLAAQPAPVAEPAAAEAGARDIDTGDMEDPFGPDSGAGMEAGE